MAVIGLPMQKTTLLGTSEQMDERMPALSRLRIQVFCHYRHPGHHHQPPSSSLLLFLIRAACSKLSPASLKQPAAAAETHVHTNHVSWPARPTNQYCAIEPLNLSSSVCLTWGPAMPARPSIHTTEEKLPTRRRYVGGHFKYTFSPKEIRFCLSMQSTRRGRQGWSVGRSGVVVVHRAPFGLFMSEINSIKTMYNQATTTTTDPFALRQRRRRQCSG